MSRLWRRLRKWTHDVLGWGYPTERHSGDSFQPTFGCEFCWLHVCQDSQGGWFHLDTRCIAAEQAAGKGTPSAPPTPCAREGE